jgi:hypothetical protein
MSFNSFTYYANKYARRHGKNCRRLAFTGIKGILSNVF